ncbi:MAG: DNA repair protein RecO C-terminal domain-containing protein [Muribaculaceae bacterium]|nr:DNA repair protein RecO C-terminal domain-containing protein [Muribaculaceae bacterium]
MAIEKITGIVTDVVKHSDRHNVVTLFTRHHGRVSLLSSAGTGKTARMRNASLMPLSVISADINFNPTRELQFLGKFSRDILWKDLYFNPVKSAVGIFISEFLNTYLRHSAPDPALWEFIVTSIRRLDAGRSGLANFHLAFLIEFLGYAGIRPDLTEWRDDAWFDMRGGTMSVMPPGHRDTLSPQEAAVLPLLARMNLRTAHLFRFSAPRRRELLGGLLRYYSLHFPGLSGLKSPAVLAEVFG